MRSKLASVVLVCAAACTTTDPARPDPNAGLLRDFVDGKFDAAGHPLNARVLEAEALCPALPAHDGAVELRATCEAMLPEGVRSGEITANVRLRVRAHADRGAIVRLSLVRDDGHEVTETLTVSRLRDRADWIDFAVTLDGGTATALRIAPASGAEVDVDYVELFPRRLGFVISPGSGIYTDSEHLTFELPRTHKLDQLEVDGVDLRPRLDALLLDHIATRTTTQFRTVIDVPVADLLPARADVTELRARAGDAAARVQLRTTAAACSYEGDPAGTRVLVTGFQPFPADGWHDNVSAVAITALDPTALHGARVMRMVLPVEYDRAAALVTDAIARCEPDIVISFGQGGNDIALEHVAYNLQDTGEISGPDNRGIIRAAAPIDETAPATRDTLLPIDAIRGALETLGEAPEDSTDPGRYICNNVMFADLGAMAPRGGRAGFIHLPYTTQFDDATRTRFGKVVAAAIQATVDAN